MPKYLLETELKKEKAAKLRKIKKDYDLEGMKANDLEMLDALAFALVQLEHIEREIYKSQKDGDFEAITELQKIATSVRKDIISYQDKLGITRNRREKEENKGVAEFINDLKKRASKLYDREMIYLFCPETHKLLGSFWIKSKKGQHKVYLYCEDCGKHHFFNPAKLAKQKKRNSIEDVPEGL